MKRAIGRNADLYVSNKICGQKIICLFQVYQFRLNGRPLSVADLIGDYLAQSPDNTSQDVQNTGDPLPFSDNDASQPRIVWRERSQVQVKRRVFMSETGTYPQ